MFLERNQNQSLEDAIEQLEKILTKADNAGLDAAVYISMAFGNPYGDLGNGEEVIEAVGLIADLGVRQVSLADTVGLATPEQVKDLVSAVIAAHGDLEIGAHLHSTQADAAAKVIAAYDAGCRRFDPAIGGLGGRPFPQNRLVRRQPIEAP